MKALIISDDETFYLSLEKKISELGYSTILYKWLLKALDNIDEINPDLIILSAEDYPRHWKVLAQHIENKIKNKNLKVFLFTSKDFSKEEKKKADFLGVEAVLKNSDEDFLNKLKNPLDCSSEKNEQNSFGSVETDKDSKKSLLKRIEQLRLES